MILSPWYNFRLQPISTLCIAVILFHMLRSLTHLHEEVDHEVQKAECPIHQALRWRVALVINKVLNVWYHGLVLPCTVNFRLVILEIFQDDHRMSLQGAIVELGKEINDDGDSDCCDLASLMQVNIGMCYPMTQVMLVINKICQW